jgi:hypothetical protein
MDARNQIVGTWKLISVDLVSDEESGSKSIAQPLGSAPLGRIMFNSDSYMNATLTHPDHAKPFASQTPWGIAPDRELAFAARTMTTYCGPYKVYSEDGETRLSTDVEIALDPSWIGTAQVRRVSLRNTAGKQIMVLRPVQLLRLPVSLVPQRKEMIQR